jgi:hypothetical protein
MTSCVPLLAKSTISLPHRSPWSSRRNLAIGDDLDRLALHRPPERHVRDAEARGDRRPGPVLALVAQQGAGELEIGIRELSCSTPDVAALA